MKRRLLLPTVLVLLVGCGGDPFGAASANVDAADDQAAEAGVDGGADAGPGADGAAADAGDGSDHADAVTSSDSPAAVDSPIADVGTDSGAACCMMPTAACSYTLASCPIASENQGTWPTSFELYTSPAEFCTTTATPSACLCNYTCACIMANYSCPGATLTCTSDPVQGILVTCST